MAARRYPARVYVVLFVAAPARFSLWSPYTAAVDEMVQLYEGGRNFAERGFAVDWFLPDLSTSSSPLYHRISTTISRRGLSSQSGS